MCADASQLPAKSSSSSRRTPLLKIQRVGRGNGLKKCAEEVLIPGMAFLKNERVSRDEVLIRDAWFPFPHLPLSFQAIIIRRNGGGSLPQAGEVRWWRRSPSLNRDKRQDTQPPPLTKVNLDLVNGVVV